MGIICETCGRDIDALFQDNMGVDAPLCEDCWNERNEQQRHAAESLRREIRNLRFENARLREKLDARAGEAVPRPSMELGPTPGVAALRKSIETVYKADWARTMALTKLSECEMWLGRCEPRETAAPTLKGAASPADAPCLKDAMAHDFAMPDVNVEMKPDKLAKCLREALQPAMRMAVE